MISVREVTAEEWPLWRDVRLAALADAPDAFAARLDDWARGGERIWRERLTLPGAYNIVAEQDGHAVGVARGVPGEDGVAWIHSVWVAPGVRGLGVGAQLLSRVEEWARGRGSATLRLQVFEYNERAIAAYRRQGFVRTGAADGGEIVMVKTIA